MLIVLPVPDLTELAGGILELIEDVVEVAVSSVPDLSRAAAGAGHGSPEREPAEADETLEQVFEEFRDEVSRQSGVDHSAQHLTLAHTYLQMGMAEEAIESLQALCLESCR